MPFYEYQCKACGAQVEVLQKISDAPLKKCPECGKLQLVKLVSAPVFRLKGGGWYETDFKTDKDAKRNLVDNDKGETKSAETSDTKTENKAEAKPEDKAAAKSEAKPKAEPVKKKPVARASRGAGKSRGRARP